MVSDVKFWVGSVGTVTRFSIAVRNRSRLRRAQDAPEFRR
jgi:hypothetical protein